MTLIPEEYLYVAACLRNTKPGKILAVAYRCLNCDGVHYGAVVALHPELCSISVLPVEQVVELYKV